MRLRLYLFLSMLTCLILEPAYAQVKDLIYTNYDTKSGLSSYVVTDIAQERSGFLWIATQNGLNRFDGNTFTIFNHAHGDSSSIANNMIKNLFVDQNSNVWIGYASGGIQGLNLRTNHRYTFNKNNGLPPTSVSALHVDREGILWAGFISNGLVRIDPSTRRVEQININNHPNSLSIYNTVYDIHEDDNMLWLATHGGLYKYDKTTREVVEYDYYHGAELPQFRNDLFGPILPDGNKGLWLSSWSGGISYFDFVTKDFTTYKYDSIHPNLGTKNIVLGIIKMENSLWLATRDQGLMEFNLQSKKFSAVKSKNSNKLPVNLNTIFRDKSGQIWIGSDDGLFQVTIDAPTFEFNKLDVTHTDNLEFYPITRIVEDTVNNKLVLGVAFADGLNVIDLKTQKQSHYPIEPSPNGDHMQVIIDLLYQSPDSIWVITRDYIKLFNPSNQNWIPVKQPPKSGPFNNRFVTMKRDSKGNFWITTLENGVFKLDARLNEYTHVARNLLPSNNVSRVEFDRLGNQIISSHDNGIVLNFLNGKKIHLKKQAHVDSIKSDMIESMIVDHAGNVWVCFTDNGISKISGKSIADGKIEIDNFLKNPWLNLPSFDLVEASDGNIWVATVNGIVRFNPENDRTEIFNASHGLKSFFIDYRFSLSGNKLFISTYGGYYEVYPDQLRQPKNDIQLAINSFKVNGKEHYLREDSTGYSVTLGYNENSIAVDFTAIEFKMPQQARIFYKLIGVDKSWLDGKHRSVTYSNLQPGNYVFQMIADNIEEAKYLNIYISITSPFWKTQWFYMLGCVVIITIAWLIINNRVRSAMREERLKGEFNRRLAESQLTALQSQMNPHFIFNSLNAINRYIIKENTHNAVDYLAKFSRLIRSILENSVEKTVSLEKELKTIRLYLELEASRYDDKFTFEIVLDNSMDPDIEIPSMIIQPFLENSIWHGILHREGQGFIKVEILNADENFLKCVITDNGIGRKRAFEINSKSATKSKSYGIGISQERLQIINGDFQAKDLIKITDLHDIYGAPEGTRVEIKLRFSHKIGSSNTKKQQRQAFD